MSNPATAKICVSCKQDVSDKPRIKDAQGRYMCKACVEQRRAGGRAPAPRPASQVEATGGMLAGGGMAEMLDKAVAAQPIACPSCQRPINPGAVMCMHCGYSAQTGKTVKTRVVKVEEKKEKKEGGFAMPSISLNIPGELVGLAAALVFIGGGFVAGKDEALFNTWLIGTGVSWLVILVWTLYVMAKDESVGKAIIGFFVPLYSVYWLWVDSERTATKYVYTVLLGCAVFMRFMARYGGGPEF